MASRFFHGSSDSDSDDSGSTTATTSSSDYSSDDSASSVAEESAPRSQQRSAFSRFLRNDDSDSDGDEKRVVRSAKDKLWDDVRSIVKSMDNSKKINDWVNIQVEFDKLTKLAAKMENVVRNAGCKYPGFLLKSLVELDEFLKLQHEDKEAKKRLNALNAKALTAMKQKLRKFIRPYELAIEEWRKNPVGLVDEDEPAAGKSSGESSESEAETKKKPVAAKHAYMKKSKFLKQASSSSSSDDEEEEDEASEDEKSDDSEAKGANRWRKSTASTATLKKPAPLKQQQKQKLAVDSSDAEAGGEEGGSGFTTVTRKKSQQQQRPEAVDDQVTPANLNEKLREILEARGKKGTDRAEQITILEGLLPTTATPAQRSRVLMMLVSARFDFNPGTSTYQSTDLWLKTQMEINQIIQLLEDNRELTLSETVQTLLDDEIDDANPQSTVVRGSLISHVSRLDDEFNKSLQNTDTHTMEYVDRLKDELSLYGLIVRTERYYESLPAPGDSLALVKLLRLNHIYAKYNAVSARFEDAIISGSAASQPSSPRAATQPIDIDRLIHDLCVYLYKNGPDRLRTRAVLCHVYHHALHCRFHQARDLLLMSHLQESIQNADVPTQILYNRAMTQIGICAFRLGMIKESHGALNDIMASLKTKDILAQGTQLQRYYQQQQAADQERKERQRMLPYHMHINLELLEAIQLTVAMLLEVPAMAANKYDPRRRVVSKHYRRLFDYAERQVFQGPAENFKDSIMQASRALLSADWQKCIQLLLPLKIWNLLPNAAEVKLMLEQKIKEEALRVFLFTYAQYYDMLSLNSLTEQFQLSYAIVCSSVSRMILGDELHGTIDEQSGMISLAHVEPTKLQYLALQACEKLNILVESNEKMFESKSQQQQFIPSSSGLKQQQQFGSGFQQSQNQQQRFGTGSRRPSHSQPISAASKQLVGH